MILCSIKVFKIGALTSKPYAFTARSWELNSIESIDFFDALGSNIRVDTRGSEIMRILPKVNNKINEEWISDKVRFSYDGLKRQRLSVPMVRKEGKLQPVSWQIALTTVADYIKSVNNKSLNFILGDFVDFETQIFLKFIAPKFCFNVYSQDLSVFNHDFESNFLLSKPIVEFDKVDLFLLIGANVRLESPILNLRIRKRVNEGAKVFYFGQTIDLAYKYTNLGSSISTLKQLIEGKHSLSKLLLKSKNPLILVGTTISQRCDASTLYSLLRYLTKFTNIMPSFLHLNSSRINAADLNLINSNTMELQISKSYPKLLYFINADNVVVNRNKSDLIVYQGHHGDRVANVADVILPGSAPTEKNSIFINNAGKIQVTKFIFAPPGDSRNDWKILKALSEVLGFEIGIEYGLVLDILTIGDIHKIVHMYTTFKDKKHSYNFKNLFENNQLKLYNNIPLGSNIENFYLNNSISRSSFTMSLAAKRFIKNVNYV
jgi:NADH dehydrogenase/NADH:ubiquinone oxidoreductase subunit G